MGKDEKMAKINLKMANKREDFLHKLSYSMLKTKALLRIENMTKSAVILQKTTEKAKESLYVNLVATPKTQM
jgi:hypothetical protein